MKCKKAERLLSRSLDGFLEPEEEKMLDEHMENCLNCQTKTKEYHIILDALKQKKILEPQPYFWERLQPKLEERKKFEPWMRWKWFSIRAIPLCSALLLVFAVVIAFFLPSKSEEMSQTETLLLRNLNPLQETRTLLEEERIEDKNIMLIFTALEEKNEIRRYFP
ncbi:MAG: anti-sigma factor [Candidatus Aminicenantaceae bacterium]